MKRKLFAGIAACLMLAASSPQSGRAARVIPVTVDGKNLSAVCYLENGVTSVPLRTLLDALGGWTVYWDASSRSARAVNGETSLQAQPGQRAVTGNGVRHTAAAAVFVENGRTYVPLRTVCELLGLEVSWSSSLGGAAVSTALDDSEELYWLSRIISAESRGEPLAGQIAVGNVVLNRVASEEFPDTIAGVIFDKVDGVQFEPVSNGTVYQQPTGLSITAARAALAGKKVVGNCMYFFSPTLSEGTWIRQNRTYYTTIGCHQFYL